MKKVLQVQPQLTKDEKGILDNHFYLPGWQFETLIGNHCTEISSHCICWREQEPLYATVYGLNAIIVATRKPCMANFFVHYRSQVFQCGTISMAARIPELLRKEYEWENYQHELWKQKKQERENNKEKIKKLKYVATNVE